MITERKALKLALDKKVENARELGLNYEQMEVLQFLDGSSSLDGVWFGEEHPKALQGKYWWRKHLHRAFDIAFHGIKEKYNEKNEM